MRILKQYKINKQILKQMGCMASNILRFEDIEEKIELNLKKGFTLITLKNALEIELCANKRHTLSLKLELYNSLFWLFKYRKYMRIILSNEIQAQNLVEQISYIDKKIIKSKEK